MPDLGKKQADREIAARTEEAQQKPVDVIEHMRKEADFQTARAVDQKALADSRAPSEANRIAARLYRAFCHDAPLLVHCRSCRTQRECLGLGWMWRNPTGRIGRQRGARCGGRKLRLVTARARDAGNRLACLGIKNAFRAICDEAAGGASTRDAFVGALGRANFWLVPEQAQCGGTLVWIRDAACYTRSVAAMSRRQAGEGLRGVGGFCYAGERLLRIGKRRVCRGKVCFQLAFPPAMQAAKAAPSPPTY